MKELNDEVARIDRAERKARRLLKKHGYHENPYRCCQNCQYHDTEYGEESRCGLVNAECGYDVAHVRPLGVCDKFNSVFVSRSTEGKAKA